MPKLALTTSGHEQNLTIGHVSSALLQRAYERPPFLKAVAAFPAAARLPLQPQLVWQTQPLCRRGIRQSPTSHGAERQIPTHEPSSNTLEELGEGFLAIFGFSQ